MATAVGPAPLINSTDAGLSGADATQVALCYSSADPGGNALDPAKVAGKIVVCERGVTARVPCPPDLRSITMPPAAHRGHCDSMRGPVIRRNPVHRPPMPRADR